MKILHVSGAMSWRGGEQQLLYLCEELKLHHVEQLVVCPVGSELYNRLQKTDIEHVITYKKNSGISLFFASALKKIGKKHKVDLMHVHDAHAHTTAFLSAWLLGNKTPIIVSRRVDFPIGKSWFSKLKYNYRSISSIICVSEAIKKIMSVDIKNKNILSVVHSGIDLNRFPFKEKTGKLRPLLNLNEATVIVGNTSAIAPHKDYFTFVDTAAIILIFMPQIHFVIIGNGPLEDKIKDYINQKGLTKNITLTGFRNDVPELLPDFDIFLITSKTEGLGTSVLDAFACNVPVVATNAGGIGEMVENGKTGLLANVGNATQLAENVTMLLKDELLRRKIKEGAAAKLRSFTKEETAKKTLEIYKKILSDTHELTSWLD